MIKFIDTFLNQITMYRLVLYHLIILLLLAFGFSVAGWLAFSPLALLFSTLYLVAISWVTNWLFAKIFGAAPNVESVYITALILALIVTPATTSTGYIFLTWVAIWSMASKYIFAWHKKHVFNPAAFAVTLTAVTINQSASWWVGTAVLLPFVVIGGLLIMRKLRQSLVISLTMGVALITILISTVFNGFNPLTALTHTLLHSPLIFFATIMFSEPLTMPPRRWLQMIYGTLVGLLFTPAFHIGSLYTTPEIALLIGNIFSYSVSPKVRRVLELVQKVQLTPDTYDFIFATNAPFSFKPGQYMEWTLPHAHADGRGNRRYFTLASAPEESQVHLGVKFYPESSSFKQALWALQPGQPIVAAQVAGDFILPKDPTQKIVFIAGGIGITPYRSMMQHLLDTNQTRPITMFYAARTLQDFAYHEVFDEAYTKLGIPTIYVPSETAKVPADWAGERGLITPELISKYVPDYTEHVFYLSGPHAMVTAFEDSLKQMGIPTHQIKTDFFPGFV